MLSNPNSKPVIISVGGTPAPVIFSLNQQQPDYICFFVSKESKDSIEKDILPNLSFTPRHYDWIVAPSPEDLSGCYREITRHLPVILNKWGAGPGDLVVDYTGGTKTMSVALVLATIADSSSYTYIGGAERTKRGLGVVINGKEKMWYQDNPWDEIALKEKREACLLFNKARYMAASEVFSKVLDKVSPRKRAFFDALCLLSKGYAQWDKFNHKQATKNLYRAKDIIFVAASLSENHGLLGLSETLKGNLRFLGRLKTFDEERGLWLSYDLISNAKRRADLENKYDDAVARLYRSVEAIAQYWLKKEYNISTSDVNLDLVPEHLRAEYNRKYLDEKKGKIKLPLYASYNLLRELGHEIGNQFFLRYDKELRGILDRRNNSILAHGFDSIKEETFRRMYSVVLEFLGITGEQLPQFPVLEL